MFAKHDPKVLIVDDSEVMRKLLGSLLKNNGFEVVEAKNGRDAINIFWDVKPDLITMDITMPEMDGITTLKEIMKLDPHARIVMISAVGTVDRVKDAIYAGAKSFVVKPYEANKVIATLRAVLEKK
ncbi:MAG: response regulator [Candidatus Riflebacteria bacterium]|nr:response regulator [Candidatus Riflebacteria bacterium]